jgi:uncharacterized membrane protein (UPF0127 family)
LRRFDGNALPRAAVLLVVLAVGLAGAAWADVPAPPATVARPDGNIRLVQADAADDFVAVIDSAGGAHRFTVEIADTPDERAQGLMFRESMATDAGMLFDYGSDQEGVAFWMRNTPLPLDMIFIRADGTITQIAADTTPYSLEPIASREPVRFVLEVNAGVAASLGIAPGDRLQHPRVTGP